MKTISYNLISILCIIMMLVKNLCNVVAYHCYLSNHRPTYRQSALALGTFMFLLAIVGLVMGTLTAADAAVGHVCNAYK